MSKKRVNDTSISALYKRQAKAQALACLFLNAHFDITAKMLYNIFQNHSNILGKKSCKDFSYFFYINKFLLLMFDKSNFRCSVSSYHFLKGWGKAMSQQQQKKQSGTMSRLAKQAAANLVKKALKKKRMLLIVKIVAPFSGFIVLVLLLLTFASIMFSVITGNQRVFESPDDMETQKLQQKIVDVVVDAYGNANEDILNQINAHYNEESKKYNYATKTIDNPMEQREIMEDELYKTYAMFSVYKDRKFAIESAKSDNMDLEKQADIYDSGELKKMIMEPYKQGDTLLSFTVEPRVWLSVKDPGPDADEDTPIETETHCQFKYTIHIANISEVGPLVFGLEDLRNSTDPEIPDTAKINEIEMAYTKTASMYEIFYGLLAEDGYMEMYGLDINGNETYVSTNDYTPFINYTVSNINFTPDIKMSVPLGGKYKYSSAFGPRVHPIYKRLKLHTGLDLGASEGVPIYALANGVVVSKSSGTGYGNYVVIYHGQIGHRHYFSSYAHMVEACPLSIGTPVYNHTVIGKVGTTGTSTGNHLHIETRVLEEQIGGGYKLLYHNPESYIDVGTSR